MVRRIRPRRTGRPPVRGAIRLPYRAQRLDGRRDEGERDGDDHTELVEGPGHRLQELVVRPDRVDRAEDRHHPDDREGERSGLEDHVGLDAATDGEAAEDVGDRGVREGEEDVHAVVRRERGHEDADDPERRAEHDERRERPAVRSVGRMRLHRDPRDPHDQRDRDRARGQLHRRRARDRPREPGDRVPGAGRCRGPMHSPRVPARTWSRPTPDGGSGPPTGVAPGRQVEEAGARPALTRNCERALGPVSQDHRHVCVVPSTCPS